MGSSPSPNSEFPSIFPELGSPGNCPPHFPSRWIENDSEDSHCRNHYHLNYSATLYRLLSRGIRSRKAHNEGAFWCRLYAPKRRARAHVRSDVVPQPALSKRTKKTHDPDCSNTLLYLCVVPTRKRGPLSLSSVLPCVRVSLLQYKTPVCATRFAQVATGPGTSDKPEITHRCAYRSVYAVAEQNGIT
uniref:Uncharacterized protein n=1 Tax=Anopheles arabiensis TaxID=7173 RepID=A0A182I353_ANOAR